MSRPKSLFSTTLHADAPTSVISRDQAEALSKRVLAFAKADETAVSIASEARANTRFAVNQVSTAGDDVDTTITVRSAFGKRSASVTTNKTDDASLAATVRAAEELARLAPEDPEYMPMLAAQTYAGSAGTAPSLPSSADRAAAVKLIADRARAAGFVATGYIEATAGARALANSHGLFAYDHTGGANLTATVRTPDGTGSGWGGANANDWSGIDPAAVAATATDKAARSRDPVAVEPGRYTVVLEPTAVGNMIQLIAFGLQARSADEGRSAFSRQGGGNKIGSKVADPRITLVSDPADNLGDAFTFDGAPSQRVVWIQDGVLQNLNYDRYWAQHSGKQPTNAPFRSLKLSGGTTSIPQMILAPSGASS